MANKNTKPTYAGRVGHGGSQAVDALFKSPERTHDRKVTGTDLRTPKKNKTK